MGTTIESDWENTRLLEELAAARAEIERLQAESDPEALHIAYLHGQADRNQKLAAEQAKNVELREALHYSLGAWEYDGISDEHGSIFQEARSRCDAPSDTSALEAIVKKAGEVMRKKCVEYMLLDRNALDSNKAVWAENPHLTPDEDYISEWEDKAREGEFEAEAIRALSAVTLEDL